MFVCQQHTKLIWFSGNCVRIADFRCDIWPSLFVQTPFISFLCVFIATRWTNTLRLHELWIALEQKHMTRYDVRLVISIEWLGRNFMRKHFSEFTARFEWSTFNRLKDSTKNASSIITLNRRKKKTTTTNLVKLVYLSSREIIVEKKQRSYFVFASIWLIQPQESVYNNFKCRGNRINYSSYYY